MNVAFRLPADDLAQSHRRAANINAAIERGRSVESLEVGGWKSIRVAHASGPHVLLFFADGTDRRMGTESNDTFTLRFRG